MLEHPERVYFEAVVPSEGGGSIFAADAAVAFDDLTTYRPAPGRVAEAAVRLQRRGFHVRHLGTFSVSGDAPRHLWQEVFGTRVEERRQPLSLTHPGAGELRYLSHVADVPFVLPADLEGLVERAYPQPPPVFFESPLPPRVGPSTARLGYSPPISPLMSTDEDAARVVRIRCGFIASMGRWSTMRSAHWHQRFQIVLGCLHAGESFA